MSADQECAEFGARPPPFVPRGMLMCQPIRSAPNSAPTSGQGRCDQSGVSADQECAEFGASRPVNSLLDKRLSSVVRA